MGFLGDIVEKVAGRETRLRLRRKRERFFELLSGSDAALDKDLGPDRILVTKDGGTGLRVCGVYAPQAGRPHLGRPAYYCAQNGLYLYALYADPNVETWAVGDAVGRRAFLAVRRTGGACDVWEVWDGKGYKAAELRLLTDPDFVEPLRAAAEEERRRVAAERDAAKRRQHEARLRELEAAERKRQEAAARRRAAQPPAAQQQQQQQHLETQRLTQSIRAARKDAAARGPPSAIRVTSRFGNLDGGYRLKAGAQVDGRPVWYNDEDKMHLLYCAKMKKWVISQSSSWQGDRYSWMVATAAETRRQLPLGCEWEEDVVLEVICPRQLELPARPGADGAWVDPAFPPTDASIGPRTARNYPQEKYEWIRGLYLAGEPGRCRLYDNVEAADIMQGALGDCWLLSAIANVAEFPSYVPQHLIHEKEATRDGKYHVKLYCPAQRKRVMIPVDDHVPCHPKKWYEAKAKPLFAQPNGNELYVLLLEKAFAKYAGGYVNLAGGQSVRAWLMLTGCEEQEFWELSSRERVAKQSQLNLDLVRKEPKNFQRNSSTYNPQRRLALALAPPGRGATAENSYYVYLRRALGNNNMAAAFVTDGSSERKRSDGLVTGHAYSLLSLHEVKDRRGRVVLLVRLRNPWGRHEWNGAWSDFDAESWQGLDKATVRSLGPRDSSDGAFFMQWTDFVGIFTEMQLSRGNMGQRATRHVDPTADSSDSD